jgi:hypothetical protein
MRNIQNDRLLVGHYDLAITCLQKSAKERLTGEGASSGNPEARDVTLSTKSAKASGVHLC